MSLAVKTARAQAQGDPGLFGDIFGGIKGAVGGLLTGGPLGAIGGAVRGVQQAQQAGRRPAARPGARQRQVVMPGVGARRRIQATPVRKTGGARGVLQRMIPGGATGFEVLEQNGGAGPAPSGWHWNKSAYTLQDGTHVAKGTKLVRNRRRNPGNARANSRAIARISSAKKMAKHLSRISIREPKSCR